MFDVLDPNNAPDESRPVLEETKESYGMIPNLYGVLAENPGALKAYRDIASDFSETGLNPAEQQVVAITVSVTNGCTYCVAAHSAMSAGQKVFDEETLEALRAGESLPDDRLEALRSFTRQVVETRGRVDDHHMQAFLDAGFTSKDVLAVVTGVAMKTISNYTNHVADTPLDAPFQRFEWTEPAASTV